MELHDNRRYLCPHPRSPARRTARGGIHLAGLPGTDARARGDAAARPAGRTEGHLWLARRSRSQIQLIHLADQVGAETVVRLLFDKPEPAGQINVPCGHERVIGPQANARVASLTSELEAAVDQSGT